MSSSISLTSGCAVIHCPRSDCDLTFSDPELLDFHIARIHKLDVPKEPVNDETFPSLKSIRKQNQTYFQLCPPKLFVQQNIILHCLDPDCDHTFESEGLRDFHYNRMHHARHPSMISQLTGTVEQRLYGYECLKADCDSRFLSEELRDFHVARVHPKIWQSICEARGEGLDTKDNEPEEQTAEEVKQLINEITTNLRETNSRTLSKESIFSEQSGYSTDATSVVITSDEEDSAKKLNALVLGDAAAEGNQNETASAGAINIKANSAPAPMYYVENELANISRLTLASRSRSFFMMNRNAVANPGASMWRPQ